MTNDNIVKTLYTLETQLDPVHMYSIQEEFENSETTH